MTVLTIIGIVFLIFGLMVYDAFSWGFVCFKFWYWFILPIFVTLPVLSLYSCIGLMFFISLFKNHNLISPKQENEDKYTNLTVNLLSPWLILFSGWLIKTLFL